MYETLKLVSSVTLFADQFVIIRLSLLPRQTDAAVPVQLFIRQFKSFFAEVSASAGFR